MFCDNEDALACRKEPAGSEECNSEMLQLILQDVDLKARAVCLVPQKFGTFSRYELRAPKSIHISLETSSS